MSELDRLLSGEKTPTRSSAMVLYKDPSTHQAIAPTQETRLASYLSEVVMSEVRLKIGLHWSPIDGNAAEQYGWRLE